MVRRPRSGGCLTRGPPVPHRVLLDARARGGGPEVYVRRLTAGLQSVAASTSPPIMVRSVRGSELTPAFSPLGGAWVAAAACRWRADLVHGLHVEVPPGRVPAIVTVQDLIPLDVPGAVPSPLRRLRYRQLLASALRRVRRVIVPSAATRDRLEAHGVDARRIVVVPLGAGPDFRPLTPQERTAARNAFADGRRYVVASTGTRAHKNLAGLVAATAALGPDVVVAATGTPPRPPPPGLRYVGRLDDEALARFYGGAEVMVLAALVEGFGLPALEALACRVPVVCGPATGAVAYLGSGMMEVDVRRPDELAEAVGALLHDDGLRARLGAAGLQAAAPLTVDAMARATLAVYLDVLSPPQE